MVEICTQFSIFLLNKPGVLAGALRTLADQAVNLLALTLVDSQEHGVVRVVIAESDLPAARQALLTAGFPLSETEVLCVEVSNEPGSLAVIAELLGANHVNVSYAYCTTHMRLNCALAILKVADTPKGLKLLSNAPDC